MDEKIIGEVVELIFKNNCEIITTYPTGGWYGLDKDEVCNLLKNGKKHFEHIAALKNANITQEEFDNLKKEYDDKVNPDFENLITCTGYTKRGTRCKAVLFDYLDAFGMEYDAFGGHQGDFSFKSVVRPGRLDGPGYRIDVIKTFLKHASIEKCRCHLHHLQ